MRVCIHHGPGHNVRISDETETGCLGTEARSGCQRACLIPQNITVDEIAHAPKDLPDDRKDGSHIEGQPDRHMLAPGNHGHGCQPQEDRAKECHPAVPDRKNVERLFQVVLNQIRLLEDKVQPSANEST